MMRPLSVIWLMLLMFATAAQAGPLALPPPPQTGFVQQLAMPLPLQEEFTDDSGRAVRLASFFGARPVVLVLGYYHCPNLCSTLMDGVLESLADVRLPPHAYRVLGVSIDPAETAADAARRKAAYATLLNRAGGDLHLLTGRAREIEALVRSAGFRYEYDAALREYAHPAGFLIATPDGRISHYFMGVRFDPRDVRLALIDASSGRIGSPADRLLLLCSHYDPATGRYSTAAMTLVRSVCLLMLAALAGWIWSKRAAHWKYRSVTQAPASKTTLEITILASFPRRREPRGCIEVRRNVSGFPPSRERQVNVHGKRRLNFRLLSKQTGRSREGGDPEMRRLPSRRSWLPPCRARAGESHEQ